MTPYVFVSPFFLLFFLVGLFPILYTAWVSLHDWDLIRGQGDFVGLANFEFVLGSDNFYKALRNTFSIFLLSSVPQAIAAILIAYVLDANLRAKTFWRMGVLVPFIVAPVAVSLIFTKIFADQSGLVNNVLMGVGLPAIEWHSDALAAHFAIATMVNFRWTGYNALIFLAAMQAIPREIYEAAIIDGTGRMRRFLHVTVPMLRPTIIFVVITSTIGGLQIFDEPRMFDTGGQGGASRQWMTMTMYLYELGWGPQISFGRASAVASQLPDHQTDRPLRRSRQGHAVRSPSCIRPLPSSSSPERARPVRPAVVSRAGEASTRARAGGTTACWP